MAVLLTNQGGFSAHVDGHMESLFAREGVISGELLGHGTRLVFAPSRDEAPDKRTPAGGFSFIWDVAGGSGYVMSEALQGYAPVSVKLQVTNVVTQAKPGFPQKLGGHPCETEDATLQLADGTTRAFQVLRAVDLHGFPARITSLSNAPPVALTFSKIRLELPPADLFSPPGSFTKYTSAEAMVDELAARHHHLRRKRTEIPPPVEAPPPR